MKTLSFYFTEIKDIEDELEEILDTIRRDIILMREIHPETNTLQGILEKYVCYVKNIDFVINDRQHNPPEIIDIDYKYSSTLDRLLAKFPHISSRT